MCCFPTNSVLPCNRIILFEMPTVHNTIYMCSIFTRALETCSTMTIIIGHGSSTINHRRTDTNTLRLVRAHAIKRNAHFPVRYFGVRSLFLSLQLRSTSAGFCVRSDGSKASEILSSRKACQRFRRSARTDDNTLFDTLKQ